MLVIGSGMYVKGSEENDHGTIIPSILEAFKKNLVDEQLREKLKAETENERNLILGIAFSKGNFNSE